MEESGKIANNTSLPSMPYMLLSNIWYALGNLVTVLFLFNLISPFPMMAIGAKEVSEGEYVINWYNVNDNCDAPTFGFTPETLEDITMFEEKGEITLMLEREFDVIFNLLGGANNIPMHIILSTLLLKDLIPDIFFIQKDLTMSSDMTKTFSLMEVCAEITEEEIATHMPEIYMDIEETSSELGYDSETIWKRYSEHGKLYVIPRLYANSISPPLSPYPHALLWRKDILDDLEKSVPKTIEECEEIFRAYKENHPYSKPWAIGRGNFIYGVMGISSFWNMIDGRLQLGFTLPEMVLPLFTLKEWNRQGYIAKSGNIDLRPEFVLGNAIVTDYVLYENGDWICDRPYWPGSIQDKCSRTNPEAEFVISPPPVFPGIARPSVDVVSPFGNMVFAFGKHLEQDREKLHRIMRIVDKLTHEEKYFLLANFGVEGKHWKWDIVNGEKFPKRLAGAETKEDQNKLNIGQHWFHAHSELTDLLLVHPRIRQSRDENCVGIDAPFSKHNILWNHHTLESFMMNAEMYLKFHHFILKYIREVYEPIVFRSDTEENDMARIEQYREYWRKNGKELVDTVNQNYYDVFTKDSETR